VPDNAKCPPQKYVPEVVVHVACVASCVASTASTTSPSPLPPSNSRSECDPSPPSVTTSHDPQVHTDGLLRASRKRAQQPNHAQFSPRLLLPPLQPPQPQFTADRSAHVIPVRSHCRFPACATGFSTSVKTSNSDRHHPITQLDEQASNYQRRLVSRCSIFASFVSAAAEGQARQTIGGMPVAQTNTAATAFTDAKDSVHRLQSP